MWRGSKQGRTDKETKYFFHSLSQNFLRHVTKNIRQAEVAAGVAVCEAFVVEPEEVEHGGVEVVNVHDVFDGAEAEFIGGTVGVAAASAAAGARTPPRRPSFRATR